MPGSFAADGLLARITLEQNGSPNLSEAFSALDSGETERGLNLLIEAIATADGDKDEIRKVVVGVLDELGADTDLARSARRQLATPTRALLDGQRQLLGFSLIRGQTSDAHAKQAAQVAAGGTHAAAPSAIRPTSGCALTATASVCARVCVEKSSSRTLIPIVRPRRPWRSSAPQSSPTRRSRITSSSPNSLTSVSNVRSRDSDTTFRSSVTTPPCSNLASACR